MKYRIAIISAFIGNGGTSGELKITAEAQAELEAYGVDVYCFNNDNVDLLKPYFEPKIKKEDIISENICDKLADFFFKIKYRQTIVPSAEDNNTRLIAKIPKIQFYNLIPQEYDYYIWLDSKFTIYEHWLKYILWLIERYGANDIVTSRHAERNSVREEYTFMMEILKNPEDVDLGRKYSMIDLVRQINLYSTDNNFVDSKLYELTMIIYNKSMLNSTNILDLWYAHNFYLSIQDQLSFPYVLSKFPVKIFGVRQDVFNMPFVRHEYSNF